MYVRRYIRIFAERMHVCTYVHMYVHVTGQKTSYSPPTHTYKSSHLVVRSSHATFIYLCTCTYSICTYMHCSGLTKKIGCLQYYGLANASCIVRCAGCGRHNTCMQYLNNESRNKSTNVTDTYVHTYYHIDVQYTISPTHMYVCTVLAHAYVPMYVCTYILYMHKDKNQFLYLQKPLHKHDQ